MFALSSFIVWTSVVFVGNVRCQTVPPLPYALPPTVGTYKATGEMVETLEDESKMLTQIAFEESFDAETQNAAFRVWVLGKSVTYHEVAATNETFQVNETACTLMTLDEWIRTESPPSLMGYEDTKGAVRFSLKQLFSLDKKYLKIYDEPDTFRGIPVRKWMYEIKGQEPKNPNLKRIINVYAYWSEFGWSTSSSVEHVPVGFLVTKMRYNPQKDLGTLVFHKQFINIFSFVPNGINHQLFEPIRGMVCPGRNQTLPFPNVNNLNAFSIHSEILFPDYQEIRYMDTWLDARNGLLRTDLERIKDERAAFEKKSLKYQSEIVIAEMGIAFRTTYDQGIFTCAVTPFEDYDFDVQNLYNVLLPKKQWHVGKIFGLNQTEYVYIGKTTQRDIPCHLFQGTRNDWPYPEANVTSRWEWCFAMNLTKQESSILFTNGEYALTSVSIKILNSNVSSDFPLGFRILHHFYDVRVRDPETLDSNRFDLSNCFREEEKRYLQFIVDWKITSETIEVIENATSDVNFLKLWKSAIYKFSGLKPYTLRVTRVSSAIEDNNLYLKFVLLRSHSSLPTELKKTQKSSFIAENEFRDKLNSGQVFILYSPTKRAKTLNLTALPHSLKFQINSTFEQHKLTTTTTLSPLSSKSTFKLITEDDGTTTNTPTKGSSSHTNEPLISTSTAPVTTTPPIPDNLKRNTYNGHGPGTVVGVSIALLLVGMTIGSSIIFVKNNGLPPCMARGR